MDVSKRHAILIEIQSYPVDPKNVNMEHTVDVFARMNAPGHLNEFIDIKDTFPIMNRDNEADMIYHYIIYDLCYLSHQLLEIPSIELKFVSLSGEVKTNFEAKVVEFKNLKINCVDPDSDWFLPREDHGSCQTWDQKVWVYGGRRNIGKEIVVMDDVMHYDSRLNRWFKGESNSRLKPKARYGHVMFCYFNYLVIFGGMSHNGEFLGDLWVYDITKELWTPVIDNQNILELQMQNVSGVIPKERAYAAGINMKEIGAAYMVGGRNPEGFACDLWALKIDKVVQYVEDPQSVGMENFWVKKEFDVEVSELCRFGHSMAEVTNSSFFIYGGVDPANNVISHPLRYDIIDQMLISLTERVNIGNQIPRARNKPSLLSTGNNMIILYGGIDPKMRGYLTDLWHIKVYEDYVTYDRVESESKGTAYMVSWRSGFTMEYLRGINDPHLIGGTYGNNQQVQSLISIPEQECRTKADFDRTTCSPCPRGSLFSSEINDCKWCEQYEFFEENYDNYFNSMCQPCPRGLIGGNYKSCVPCAGGFIFSSRSKSHCKKCDDSKICPLGTKYEFEKEKYVELMNDIKINNVPDFLETKDEAVDHTATIIVLLLLFLTIVFVILIAIFLTGCKERSLFIFREIDSLPITGGRRKKVAGGILMIFFTLYILLIWLGYLINYLVYNERRESSETSNPFLQKDLPSSYEIEIRAFGSKVKESNAPFLIFNATAGEDPDANPTDLCKGNGIRVITSVYFKNSNETFRECKRNRLNEFTDEYVLNLKYVGIPKQEIKDGFINIDYDSDYTFAFHFFQWKFKSVWNYGFEDIATSFSEVEGIMTPQDVKDSNKNITAAFKGPIPTVLKMNLIPTHYINEADGITQDGYRAHLASFERGSTVNKRTLVDRYLALGEELKGMQIQFMVSGSPVLFQVRIQKVKSILEVVAYMLGFLAGFILIVRAAKYYLLKERYFLELEKECEKYFGRHNEIKFEEDDDITSVEMMRLERTRLKARTSNVEDIREDTRLTNRNSTIQLDNSELNDEDEQELRKLEV